MSDSAASRAFRWLCSEQYDCLEHVAGLAEDGLSDGERELLLPVLGRLLSLAEEAAVQEMAANHVKRFTHA